MTTRSLSWPSATLTVQIAPIILTILSHGIFCELLLDLLGRSSLIYKVVVSLLRHLLVRGKHRILSTLATPQLTGPLQFPLRLSILQVSLKVAVAHLIECLLVGLDLCDDGIGIIPIIIGPSQLIPIRVLLLIEQVVAGWLFCVLLLLGSLAALARVQRLLLLAPVVGVHLEIGLGLGVAGLRLFGVQHGVGLLFLLHFLFVVRTFRFDVYLVLIFISLFILLWWACLGLRLGIGRQCKWILANVIEVGQARDFVVV